MTAIQGLGEIAFRTENLPEMVAFYGDVLGLERIDDAPARQRRHGTSERGVTRPVSNDESETSAFFACGPGVAGHTQVLVLFDRSAGDDYTPPDPARTTVDHVAFGIDAADFDAEADRLEALGHDLTYAYHDWVEWNSLYLDDPDGNEVELVCHDPDRTTRAA